MVRKDIVLIAAVVVSLVIGAVVLAQAWRERDFEIACEAQCRPGLYRLVPVSDRPESASGRSGRTVCECL
ncbi:MAG: hypothetical protein KIT18_04950 [Burkholderiales bacterium]|nr:hypothetical protein [Burkholderiales bacterium]